MAASNVGVTDSRLLLNQHHQVLFPPLQGTLAGVVIVTAGLVLLALRVTLSDLLVRRTHLEGCDRIGYYAPKTIEATERCGADKGEPGSCAVKNAGEWARWSG
jgi:hypothetical protein